MLGRFFLYGFVYNSVDIAVALVCDDALRVVVKLFFAVGYMLLKMGHEPGVYIQLPKDLLIPLKQLYGVPAQVVFANHAGNGFLNMGNSVLHTAGEHVWQLAGALLFSQFHRALGGLCAALPL